MKEIKLLWGLLLGTVAVMPPQMSDSIGNLAVEKITKMMIENGQREIALDILAIEEARHEHSTMVSYIKIFFSGLGLFLSAVGSYLLFLTNYEVIKKSHAEIATKWRRFRKRAGAWLRLL